MSLQRRCLIFSSKCRFCKGRPHIFYKKLDFALEVFVFLTKIVILQRASVQFIEKTWFCKGGVQFFSASGRLQIIEETSVAKAQTAIALRSNIFSIFTPFSHHFFTIFFFRSDSKIFWLLSAAGLTLLCCGSRGRRTWQCRKNDTA